MHLFGGGDASPRRDGFSLAGEAVPAVVASILRQGPMSTEKVRFAWRTVVGASVARATSVTLADGGVLRVRAETDAWRREVRRAAAMVVNRLQGLLGETSITELEVTGPPGEVRRRPKPPGTRSPR